MDDDLCDSCGADLLETDGNTFDMGGGITVQVCPPCEARWRTEEERADDDTNEDGAL